MKHISLSLALILFLIASVLAADESSDVDRERTPRGPKLPPPLQIFDEDGDNALSTEEINKLTERLNQLDQDGDGRVDPRELEGFFGSRRPPRRGDDVDRDDRFDRRPDEGRRRGPPGRGDDRFDRDNFERDEFEDRDDWFDRFDRRPDEGRRRGPPGRGDDRFNRENFDRENRFDRRPDDRRRPPGRGDDRFDREDFDRDHFEREEFEDRDNRFDRRPDDGRRRGPPDRGDDRFNRDDFERDKFEDRDDRFDRRPDDRFDQDEFDDRGRPPSDQQRRRNDDQPRGKLGTGADRLIDRLYQYDVNGDGKLTAGELPARAKRLIEQADRDQDGSLDREELEIFLSSR